MRTPYKMKGSAFYGHGNSSPAKVSDSEVREAVAGVDKTQMKFRPPGWARAAGVAVDTLKKQAKDIIGSDQKKENSKDENVEEKVDGNDIGAELNVTENANYSGRNLLDYSKKKKGLVIK